MEELRMKYRKWIVVGIILLLFLFVVFFFRIKKITIEGNTYYSEKQMIEKFQTNIFEKNVLSFLMLDKCGLTPELPFVREYDVTYPSVNEVHIKLYEKTIVAGIAYSNQYIYFDKDGMVLQSSDKALSEIPLFETKNLTTFTLYQKVQMEDEGLLEQIMNLANLFQHYKVKWDKVEFNENKEAFLYIYQTKVLLGKKDNYDEAISALASVLQERNVPQNEVAEIDLRNYKINGDIILSRQNTK